MWASPMNFPVKLAVSPTAAAPTDFLFFFYFLFLTGLFHFIFLVQKLCGGHSWNLSSLHRNSGVGLYRIVGEFLIGRLGEHSLFPEVGFFLTARGFES